MYRNGQVPNVTYPVTPYAKVTLSITLRTRANSYLGILTLNQQLQQQMSTSQVQRPSYSGNGIWAIMENDTLKLKV